MKSVLWRGLRLGAWVLLLGRLPAGAQGIITTVAGSTWVFRGDGGPATSAPLGQIWGVATDPAGNVFASDSDQHLVIRVSTTGVLTVVAGNGIRGFSGDGGPATSASLFFPSGLAVDGAGNLYIADRVNVRVRKVSPTGVITTVAGTGVSGYSGDGGPATDARLFSPQGVAVDGAGNLYIADAANHRVRRVSPVGTITTVAGNGVAGFSGDGGAATSASLNGPSGVAVDAAGNLYIADYANARIRKVSTGGIITTVAGSGTGVALDAAGNLYIADAYNNRIWKVNPGGIIASVAGTGVEAFSGDGGPATSASLRRPSGVAVDAAGNLYIADTFNQRVRKVNTGGTITTVAGSGLLRFSGDGAPATVASLNQPAGISVYAVGNRFIADTHNHRIRRISADGTITTVAGTGDTGLIGGGFSGDGGPATNALLNLPEGVAVDAAGNLYIADSGNQRVRQVRSSGTITTVAGNGVAGFSGDGGVATSASLNAPTGVAVDAAGNLYIADRGSHRIRKVSPGGILSTVAGTGVAGFSGDGGPATSALLNYPEGVAVDAAGNVYIADSSNQRVRKVSPGGTISTVAGNGVLGFSGDGGPAIGASLVYPGGVAVDLYGSLYLAERSRVRRVGPTGIIRTVAGSGSAGFSGDGGPATSALLSDLLEVAVDGAGNLYLADTFNDRIRKVTFDYLVGDVFQASGDAIGQFGDESLNILDLIFALRAVTNLPGFRPPSCSDRYDAMDSFPADTVTARGGDSQLTTLDLIVTLRRVTNARDDTIAVAPRRAAEPAEPRAV